MSKPKNGQQLPTIRWPVPKNNRGGEFSNLEEVLAHLEGEAAGHWLIGRNGMWHGGIHISDTTTPWCALSGQAMNEAVDFPVPFKGEQGRLEQLSRRAESKDLALTHRLLIFSPRLRERLVIRFNQ
ncbi:hypothetical protein [Martelella alba]|uniref:Lysozyme n=1 Tax=Martelella alba TaxID=2590451 RepID=A0ABY2SEF4_9HYPH|nr:hypothetical protein [Martelella alba]TKI02231.1 hypothetical protein FCN80_25585 [Martelella alba]